MILFQQNCPVLVKMLYRYKLGFFVGVVASTTFFVAYVAGPKSVEGPVIRALYISFSDHLSVETTLDYKIPLVESFDKSIHIFEISEKGSLTIDRDEWDLHSDGEFGERFFQNNLVLECTASFPVTWHYSGFGVKKLTKPAFLTLKLTISDFQTSRLNAFSRHHPFLRRMYEYMKTLMTQALITICPFST